MYKFQKNVRDQCQTTIEMVPNIKHTFFECDMLKGDVESRRYGFGGRRERRGFLTNPVGKVTTLSDTAG
jgi:hypothetical protein